MSKKKLAFIICIIGILLNLLIINHEADFGSAYMDFNVTLEGDSKGTYQVYYGTTREFVEENSDQVEYTKAGKEQTVSFSVPSDTDYIRFDFSDEISSVKIRDMEFVYWNDKISLSNDVFSQGELNNVKEIKETSEGLQITTMGNDASCSFSVIDLQLEEMGIKVLGMLDIIKKVGICVFLDVILVFFVKYFEKFMILPIELYRNRRLILKLAKNDFKTKYAGSYLGIIWAFVQPIVTVLVYWFVFQVGLRSGDIGNFPFVLWLISGLVPWFFFQDALNSGTNALIEYNYLVKKVVFKISILPIIKILSALFVHAFFLAFAIILFSCYGYFPDLYSLQVIYYTLCMFVLELGLCYFTCSVVVFFRDLTQIIGIFLQVGVWITPIMWNIEKVPGKFQWLFRINPMYYIVNGYRDSLINKVWFWEKFYTTAGFWLLTIAIFGIGALVFKRLKVHFADVL